MTYPNFIVFCVVLAVAQISAADPTPLVAPKCTFNGTQIVLSVDETLAFQKSNWSMIIGSFVTNFIENGTPEAPKITNSTATTNLFVNYIAPVAFVPPNITGPTCGVPPLKANATRLSLNTILDNPTPATPTCKAAGSNPVCAGKFCSQLAWHNNSLSLVNAAQAASRMAFGSNSGGICGKPYGHPCYHIFVTSVVNLTPHLSSDNTFHELIQSFRQLQNVVNMQTFVIVIGDGYAAIQQKLEFLVQDKTNAINLPTLSKTTIDGAFITNVLTPICANNY